ncbi:MAG: PRD domain-containing protein [Traorella sp.]
MQVIKKINNNCALCLDSNQKKVVAFGKGIGFKSPPYDVELSQIHRIFYDVDDIYLNMIHDISEDILELSAKIIDYARERLDIASSNVVITLADHIQFAIQRNQKKMNVDLPIIQDIQYLYDDEIKIAKKALMMINEYLQDPLPDEEAAYIALHIINSEMLNQKQKEKRFHDQMIHQIISIIENELNIKFEINTYDYSRFVTHLQYLLKRDVQNEIHKENHDLLITLSQSFPQIYHCTMKIKDYLMKQVNFELSDDECVYLMMHVNRLCSRNYESE